MIGNIKSPSNYCKFCGWEFQNDIIQKIIEQQESAVCEFCGIEIKISSISPQEGNIKENYERTSNSIDKIEKKKKSIVKSISKLTKTKKNSVNVFMGDKDFPKIFKENLIVVISRLIYKNIRDWEQDNDVNVHQVGLTQSILITLTKKVKPIIEKRIHSSYLENLHEVTTEEFEEWLKLLQKKLRSIQEYRKHFIIYLLWLTKLVFRLVSDRWEMNHLPKFQSIILKDLKEYNFSFSNLNEKNPKKIITWLKLKIKFDKNKIIIRAFPKKTRNILCEMIYRKLIKNHNRFEVVSSIIKNIKSKKLISEAEVPLDEIEELNYGLLKYERKVSFEKALICYLNDLISLVKNIKILNENNHFINFSELSRKLIKKNRNLNLSKRGLEEAISGIYDHFKFVFRNDFCLERKKKKAINGTESEKESIRCLRKEFRLLNELYNGTFGGECSNSNCHVDFKRLPVFCFHHPNPDNKISIWSQIMHKNYLEIKKELEFQKVIPLCSNCHLAESSSIFNNFEDLIMNKDLFNYSKREIDNLIDKTIKIYLIRNKNSYNAGQIKYEIKRWIRKRSIIKQVFNGKYISCGETCLPTLSFHHTDPSIKEHKWGDISRKKKWGIKNLIENYIIKEECICLCSNCHSMVETTNYEKNFDKIIGVKYLKEIKEIYNNIYDSIGFYKDKIKNIKDGIVKIEIIEHI